MQIIHSTTNSPTFNLAAEEFLFSERQDDLLFLYVNEPSVIIGCNQAILNEVDLDFCADNNIQIVRRMSGGGAVYHDEGNLNFCFISNKTKNKSSLNSDFLLPIVDVLTSMGISVEIGKRKDLWLDGKYKISGTASHVGKTRELHHGTLLYDSDLEKLQKALSPKEIEPKIKAIASVSSQVKNIKSHLLELNLQTAYSQEFFDHFVQKLLEFYKLENVSFLSDNDKENVQIIRKNKYELREWTYKK